MLKALVREKDEKLVKQEKEILELRNNLAKLQKQCHDKNEVNIINPIASIIINPFILIL